MAPKVASLLSWAILWSPAMGLVTRDRMQAQAETPRLPYDPNTSQYCSYWFDYTDSRVTCNQVPSQWSIAMADFLRWVSALVN
jgi:hypothetical protein